MADGAIAVVDAGPLVAAADIADPDHERCLDVLTNGGFRLFLPILVITEATYLVERKLGALSEAAFVDGLTDFVIEAPQPEDWTRIAALVRQYHDFPLGATDASVVVLAERLHIDAIITLDHRHFRAVRPRHVESFRLLPE